mmetsp:Transcript_18134/g.50082  ORF Transcript_18134/g.50082 Transcript_18134/m.50082 type:complete len:346 (+) Transcript_18134:323-1360(+)
MTLVKDSDLVKVQNGLHAVRNGDDSSHWEVMEDRLLHDLLRVWIQGGGALVQQQHGGLTDHHARQAQELPLPETHVAPLLCHRGVDPVPLRAHKRQELHALQRLPKPAIWEFVKRVNVASESALEDGGILRYEPHDIAQGRQAQRAGVHTAQANDATAGLQQAQEAEHGSGLATACLSSETHLHPGSDVHGNAMEHCLLVAITCREVVDLDSHALRKPAVPQVDPDHGGWICQLLGHPFCMPADAVDGHYVVALGVLQGRAAWGDVQQPAALHDHKAGAVRGGPQHGCPGLQADHEAGLRLAALRRRLRVPLRAHLQERELRARHHGVLAHFDVTGPVLNCLLRT